MGSISLTLFKEIAMTTTIRSRPPNPKPPGPRRPRRQGAQQRMLFTAPPVLPEWDSLPEPIRRRLLELLGQMLAAAAARREVGDE
jgi:hypothetical protein